MITHNRYLLNHCFNKILHLENTEMQEFDGNYVDYNFALLQMKIEQQELAAADMEEIERNRKIVERLRNSATAIDSATRGRSLHARVSLLERLEARKTKSPFVDIKQPEIVFHADEVFDAEVSGENPEEALESERKSELGDANAENEAEKIVLSVEDYNVTFDREIMEHVSFVLHAGDKVAIVGPNGTGKTTFFVMLSKEKTRQSVLAKMLRWHIFPRCMGRYLMRRPLFLKILRMQALIPMIR